MVFGCSNWALDWIQWLILSKKDKAMNETFDEMKPSEEDGADVKDAQSAAFFAAFSIIGFSIVYWALQIKSVQELLDLAYGF